MKQQSERLGTDPIPRLLANLAIPATVGMLAMALHSIIDAIFITRRVGTVGVATVAITFPMTMIIIAQPPLILYHHYGRTFMYLLTAKLYLRGVM